MPRVPTYDLEALEWTEIIAIGFFDGAQYHEFFKTSDSDDVVWKFLSYLGEHCKGIKLYAHNAARYDAKFILAKLQEKGEPVRLDAGLFRLVWLKPRITFEDSYVALPGSLRELSKTFGVSHKLDWEHEDTDFPWRMPLDRLLDFRLYLKRDCISLSEVMEEYCKTLLSHFSVTPSLTLALTAVKAFNKKFYPVNQIESNEKYEKFIRAATYGGRNEVYRMYGGNLNFYDVRSMYVSCYDTPVPIGKMLWTTPSVDKGTLAHARVKIPKGSYLGPIPYRLRIPAFPKGRLTFPVGIVEDWYDTRELKFATEQGCDLHIYRQLQADEEPILKEFAEYVYNLRMNSTGAEARLWKLFGLRLSGKFGQSRWRPEVVHVSKVTDFTGSSPIDEREEYHEFMRYVRGHRTPYIKPALSMRIRAEARIRHTKLLLEALRKGDVFYCDNDSIVTNTELPTGMGLGQLRLTNKALRGYFIQCKFYGYVSPTGVLNQTSAGFRDFQLCEEDFQELLEGATKENSYLGLSNWRTVLQEAEVRRIKRRRKVSGVLDFRNREKIGLETKPLYLRVPKI